MFPYIDASQWHVGPVAVHPFVLLIALACTVGYLVTVWRAAREGISQQRVSELALWMFGLGFIGAGLLSLVYAPPLLTDLARHPRRLLTFYWGLASFGGFAGGLAGAAAFFAVRRIARTERIILLDAVAFSIPFGWSIGRIGCYLAHDHPGIRTSSWLGVHYPGGTRYDLGLLEVFFLLALGVVFLILGRKPRAGGFYRVTLLVSYGIFRLLQDPLHVDEARYLGWTVDQMAAVVLIACGLAGLADLVIVRCQDGFVTSRR